MNNIEHIKKCKVSYKGTQNCILKYITMRSKTKNPVVTIEEIINFFPHKIKRKDTLMRMLKTMVKNNFIKEKNSGYIITHIGKQVPFVVANCYRQSLTEAGKRVEYAIDNWSDDE